jgi:glutathione synthase/RimK-type ligase-like ATP-grasp enzyme
MEGNDNKRIGLLIGREWSWPAAFIAEVNRRQDGVIAEFVKIGETTLTSENPYAVIIDRTSHEIPYYRLYLKYAALHGTYIINNPFTVAADDKFFGVALAHYLEIQVPRTAALPNKRAEAENVPESFRNLVYPMDWQKIIDYVGVPAILKDAHTGGRRVSQRVHSVDELIRWYDESDTLTVILQAVIESEFHVHAFVVGDRAMLARYDRAAGRYLDHLDGLPNGVQEQIRDAAVRVTRAYKYDLNMVEFVRDGEDIYLINPTNPAPELDINLLADKQFAWCVGEIADLAIAMAKRPAAHFDMQDWHRPVT